MLNLEVFRIREVLEAEELLNLLDTFFGQVHDLVLLIDHVVTGLGDFFAHDGVHLGELAGCLTALQHIGKRRAGVVNLGRLAGLARNDERRSRLIDQDRVHLVDDAVVEVPEHLLVLINRHVVAQIVKAELVVRHIGDVAGIGLLSRLRIHGVQNHSDREPEEAVNASHPLRVTRREVVVDRDDQDTLARQCVQICRCGGDQGLTFTGLHLRNAALVQHNTTVQLYRVVLHTAFICSVRALHAGRTPRRLAHGRKCLRQKVIQGFARREALLEFSGLCLQFFIAHRDHRVAER